MRKFSFLLLISTLFILALGYSKGYFQNGEKQTFVNLKGVKITKKEPSTFKFQTSGPGKLYITLNKISGKSSLSDVSVRLFYKGISIVGEDFYTGSNMSFTIDEAEFYNIDFSIDKRYITLTILVEFVPDDPTPIPEEDHEDVLSITQAFFGLKKNDQKEKVSTSLFLKEGDKVMVTTTDTEDFAQALMFEYDGDGNTPHSIAKGEIIEVPETRNYTFYFYIDEEAPAFLNLDIFKKNKGARIEQVTMRKIKKGKPVTKPNSEPDPFLEIMKQQQEQNQAMLDWQKQQEKDQRKQDSLNNANLQEQWEQMQDMFGQRIDTSARSAYGDEFAEIIPPYGNLLKQNRACFEIPEVAIGNLFWVYWVGVGDDMLANYQKEEGNQQRRYAQFQTYLSYLGNLLFKRGNFDQPLPYNMNTRPAEKIEYAIVDADNRRKFLKNELFFPLSPELQGTDIGYALGNSNIPGEMVGTIYLCACNHNLNTPVKIHFKYETFIEALLPSLGFGGTMER